MDMCCREGLHQIDLLSPAPVKMTKGEYWARTHGQDELDKINEKVKASGLKPTSTVYQTQKQFLRDAITDCVENCKDFQEFQSLLLDKYNISVIEQRGSYRYLHPDREKRVSGKSLGSHFEKAFLEQRFQSYETEKIIKHTDERFSNLDYHSDPFVIFYIKSDLRLVTDLQSNVKAMQNQAYARKVKISNLQQMANTLIYVQDHGYDTRDLLEKETVSIQEKLKESQNHLSKLTSKMKTVNSQIHYTGQYFASKSVYADFLKSRSKKAFRQEHSSEIKAYEEARDWLKEFYPDGKMISMKNLKSRKSDLQESIEIQKSIVRQYKDHYKELEIAGANVDAILKMEEPSAQTLYYESPQKEKRKFKNPKKEDKAL